MLLSSYSSSGKMMRLVLYFMLCRHHSSQSWISSAAVYEKLLHLVNSGVTGQMEIQLHV